MLLEKKPPDITNFPKRDSWQTVHSHRLPTRRLPGLTNLLGSPTLLALTDFLASSVSSNRFSDVPQPATDQETQPAPDSTRPRNRRRGSGPVDSCIGVTPPVKCAVAHRDDGNGLMNTNLG